MAKPFLAILPTHYDSRARIASKSAGNRAWTSETT
jgi:hypothetical protein